MVLKMRSHVVFFAAELKRALPRAKHVYLYRHGVDTVDSFCCAFFSNPVTKLLRLLRLDGALIFRLPATRKYLPLMCPLAARDGGAAFPAAAYTSLGYVGLVAMSWLSNVDCALALQTRDPAFFDAVLTYEALVEHRVALVNALLRACGLQRPGTAAAAVAATATLSAADAAKVFDEDAHAPGQRTQSQRRAAKSSVPLFIRPSVQPWRAWCASPRGLSHMPSRARLGGDRAGRTCPGWRRCLRRTRRSKRLGSSCRARCSCRPVARV